MLIQVQKRTVTARRYLSDNQGSLGDWRTDDGGFHCFSLELPFRDNKPEISCLPPGVFEVVWTKSPRLHKWTYEILEPYPDRAGFRIHGGNFAGDVHAGLQYISHSLGCPLLGARAGSMRNPNGVIQRAVMVSQPTVRQFEDYMERKPFTLKIAEAFGKQGE